MNSRVIIKIKSKNISRLLNKIYKLNINIYNIKVLNYNEFIIEIDINDIDKIKKTCLLSKIDIIEYKGKIKYLNIFKFNKVLYLSLLVGLILLLFLTNIIFDIEVMHSSSTVRNFVLDELKKNGIHKYQLKKGFNQLEKIKTNILETNKDIVEWLEIERVGTKYIVKIEERKINNYNVDNNYGDIVSTHDAVIKKIIAYDGVKVKEVNDYVKKGDIIISGNIYLNDEIKDTVMARGEVYGEVWYKISIEYPIYNDNKEETGNSYETYSINFFNKSFLFKKNTYINSYQTKKVLFSNNIIPISITKNTIYELKPIFGVYTHAEAILNARDYSKEKITETLGKDEYIISDKVLKYEVNSNTIVLEMFYKIYKNIAGFKRIDNRGE